MSEGKILIEGRPSELLIDPDLLESNGIRPLQTAVLLKALDISMDGIVLTDAVREIQDAGWKVGDGADTFLHDDETSTPTDSVIEIEDLVHCYADGPAAVDGVSLSIHQGEFVAIVGQNGCGKTTMVKHFNGLYQPTAGSISILGKRTDEWSLSDLGRRVGYVFQNPDHQIFANTIGEEVAFGPLNYGLPSDEIESRTNEALRVVGLENRGEEDPFSLTKGERQQLAVASVLVTDPEIIILDEPTTGLD